MSRPPPWDGSHPQPYDDRLMEFRDEKAMSDGVGRQNHLDRVLGEESRQL